jgi:hypothetical protein
MNKFENLDLMGVASLGTVAAALLVGWMVTTHNSVASETTHASRDKSVTLGHDGSMKLTVTAGRESTGSPASSMVRTASVRPSGGPSLEVALPFAFRP